MYLAICPNKRAKAQVLVNTSNLGAVRFFGFVLFLG